jgi:hypothetical protein
MARPRAAWRSRSRTTSGCRSVTSASARAFEDLIRLTTGIRRRPVPGEVVDGWCSRRRSRNRTSGADTTDGCGVRLQLALRGVGRTSPNRSWGRASCLTPASSSVRARTNAPASRTRKCTRSRRPVTRRVVRRCIARSSRARISDEPVHAWIGSSRPASNASWRRWRIRFHSSTAAALPDCASMESASMWAPAVPRLRD